SFLVLIPSALLHLHAFPTRRSSDLLGPKKGEMWVAPEGPQAAEVYVLLPSDAKKRKAFFDVVTKWNLAHKRTAMTDNGGKWMILDRKSTRLNSSHQIISYAVFCLKK